MWSRAEVLVCLSAGLVAAGVVWGARWALSGWPAPNSLVAEHAPQLAQAASENEPGRTDPSSRGTRGECADDTRISELERELDQLSRASQSAATEERADAFGDAPSAARPDNFRAAVDQLVQSGEVGISVDCDAYPCLAIAELDEDRDADALSSKLATLVGPGVRLEIVRMGIAAADGEKREVCAIAAMPSAATLDQGMRRAVQNRVLKSL